MRTPGAALLALALWFQPAPGAKGMFYDPGDRGAPPAVQTGSTLRPINLSDRFLHCGIHYWLETAQGVPVTVCAASAMKGKFTLYIRTNVAHGFLTVWDVAG